MLDTAARVARDSVETARRAYAAFNDGDIDGVLSVTDPEIEIYIKRADALRAAGVAG